MFFRSQCASRCVLAVDPLSGIRSKTELFRACAEACAEACAKCLIIPEEGRLFGDPRPLHQLVYMDDTWCYVPPVYKNLHDVCVVCTCVSDRKNFTGNQCRRAVGSFSSTALECEKRESEKIVFFSLLRHKLDEDPVRDDLIDNYIISANIYVACHDGTHQSSSNTTAV